MSVLLLDRNADRRGQLEPLSPRRLWLAGRCRAFDRGEADMFTRQLQEAEEPVTIVLHENDREDALRHVDLTVWLRADPRHLLVLSSGGWIDWGACSGERIQALLAPELWQQRWAAMPWDYLIGRSRPLAWLHSSFGLTLAELCQRFNLWRDSALRCLLPESTLQDPLALNRRFQSLLLHECILLHYLNTDNEHPLEAETRLKSLLHAIDQLWLLEGLIQSVEAFGFADRLRRAREAVEGLIGRPPSTVGLSDADQRSWAPTVCVLEAIRDEPVGES